jgi:hypothetical protein
MPLIVEDGTGLANSDSYQTLANARVSAQLLGFALPAQDVEAEQALRNGARYVDGFEGSFSGTRLLSTQALSYPRENSYRCYGRNTIDVGSDSIPTDLITAQLMAAAEYGKGTDIMPVNDGLSIASSEVVGAVKESYFDNGKSGNEIQITIAIDALRSLLCVGSGLTMKSSRR